MTKPQIPGVPGPIPDDWTPKPTLHRDSAVVRGLEGDALAEAVVSFRRYCRGRDLKKTRWGTTFVWWLSSGRPS